MWCKQTTQPKASRTKDMSLLRFFNHHAALVSHDDQYVQHQNPGTPEWNYEFIILIQLLALFYTVYIVSHANKPHCAEHRG